MYKFNSEKLAYEKVNVRKYIGMIALSFLAVFILSSFIWKEVVVVNAEKEVVIKTNDSFSKEKLFFKRLV